MLAMSIWRLVAFLYYLNTVCGQYSQHPVEEYIYQKPVQHFGGYESYRQYRSSGDEPTTLTPSVTTINEVLLKNQTLDFDADSNSTHTNGSIMLVTDVPVENTSVASSAPSLIVDRDTNKSVLELSNLGNMEQLNTTIELINSTMNTSSDEVTKILKRRQAPQVVQSQQEHMPVFQPQQIQRVIPFVQSQPALLFSGQPVQTAAIQVPFGGSHFASDQLRFVQPQFLAPSQVVRLQSSHATVTVTQPSVQLPKTLLKLSLNPAPLPPSSHLNITVPIPINSSQANAVKTREANANKEKPMGQPSMGTIKPVSSSTQPSRQTPQLAPLGTASTAPTGMAPPLRRPGTMQVPVQPMVRPQLLQQPPLQQQPQPPLQQQPQPQPPLQQQPQPPLQQDRHDGQRLGPQILQPSQQQPNAQPIGQTPPAQQQQPNQAHQDAQRAVPLMLQPSQQQPNGQPIGQVPLAQQQQQPSQVHQDAQRLGSLMLQLSQQQPSQAHQDAQRLGSLMLQPSQQQPNGQPIGQTPPAQQQQPNQAHQDAQRALPLMLQPSQQQPNGQPIGQTPPTQQQPPNQANQDAQRAGPLLQPSQQQANGQPFGQTPPTQQQLNQANQDAQRSGPLMLQPSQQKPIGQPIDLAPTAQAAPRLDSTKDRSLLVDQPVMQALQNGQRLEPPMH